MCVCLLPQNCCLSSIISKSEHATALNLCKELAILLFYKADKFLKAQATQTAQKIWKCKKLYVQRWDEMLVQQNKGINRCNTWYPEDNMWGFVEKCSCVKIWHRVLTLPVAMLSMRSLDSATVLYSNSYYTVVASIFLVSTASCKAICKVTSVRTSDSRGWHSNASFDSICDQAPRVFDREVHGTCAVINRSRLFWIIITQFKTDKNGWLLHTYRALSVIHGQRLVAPGRRWNQRKHWSVTPLRLFSAIFAKVTRSSNATRAN